LLAAILKSENSIDIETVPIPKVIEGSILVKIMACGICGSDLRIIQHGNSRVKYPAIIGHEICAKIVDIGDNVKDDFKVGDRLAIGADIPCGKCNWCQEGNGNCCKKNYAIGHQFPGGFGEYCLLDPMMVKYGPIQKVSSDTDSAIISLAEPLACCINGFERVQFQPGKSVLVFGAGPIGILLALLAKERGANKVFLADINQSRLDQLQWLNIDGYLNNKSQNFTNDIFEKTNGDGVDYIFTACPSIEVQELANEVVATRGVINWFAGLPKNGKTTSVLSNDIHYKEITITGSHGSTPRQFRLAVDLIERQTLNLKPLITHRFELNEIQDALNVARSKEGLKIVLLSE